MKKLFWPLVVVVFIAALGCSVVVISILGVSTSGPAVPQEPVHTDLSTTFGSEDANVVVLVFMPVGQECVAATVQALRQLSGMYPEHLFVGMGDMEARSPALGLTFRGHPLSDTAAILAELGESRTPDLPDAGAAGEPTPEPDGSAADKSTDKTLKSVIAELERDPPKTPAQMIAEDEASKSKSFCALITINGQSRFSLPTGPGGEIRDVYFSGPYGTLYNAEDLRAAVETTIKRKYGELPEPRIPWAGVTDVMAGREPVPLHSPGP